MVPANAVAMPVSSDDSGDMLFDAKAFRHAMELAKTISQSALIPPHLRGQVPDILLALYMARTMNENPIIVLQSIHVISGRAGWSAQYLIARANGSGRFRGPIRWREEGEGDQLAVTAYATLVETGEDIEYTVTMAMAKAEGWTNRNPKYRTMPKLMLRYRSATLLVRLFCPDVLMGLHERYELIDSEQNRAQATERVAALPPELPKLSIAEPPKAEAAIEVSPKAEPPRIERPKVAPKAQVAALPAPEIKAPEAKIEPEEQPAIEPEEQPAQQILLMPEEPPQESAEAPKIEAKAEAPLEDRPAVLARLTKLRDSHPDFVREEARRMGLRSPAKSDVVRLRQLIAVVEARIEQAVADLSVKVEDHEELMITINDARAAVEEGLGPDAVLEAAQAAGLPIADEGPVLDGAPDPMLLRFLDELRDRRRIWAPPVRVAPAE